MEGESGVFVTNAVCDELPGGPWHNRLRAITLELSVTRPPGLEIFRLESS
jgi:hypothetical protein